MQSRALDRNYDGIGELIKIQSKALDRNHNGCQELMDIQSRALHRNHGSITELIEFFEHKEEYTVPELKITPCTVNT